MSFYDWFFKEVDRDPAGLFSFSHLFTVTLTLIFFGLLAFFLAKICKNNPKKQNLVLLITGITIVLLQLSKNIWLLVETDDILDCLIGNAPLYFCDISIYIIPLAAITRGRFKDWCLDFLAICGLLMGVMGNYFAGNLYPSHAIISFSVLNALLNHSLSAFISLFIWFSHMNKMEKRNIPYVIGILFIFMTVALILAYIFDKNYMFFFNGDGTPFGLYLTLVNGNKILYQILIYISQCGYMALFYVIYYLIKKQIDKKRELVEKDVTNSQTN